MLLYTDGLVEQRGGDIDAGTNALARLLRRIQKLPVCDLVDVTVDTLASNVGEDVIAFAIRFPSS